MRDRWSVIPLICLVGFLAYPASLGPAVWLVEHFDHDAHFIGFLNVFYFPLEMLAEKWPFAEKLLTDYVGLFVR